MLWLAGLITLLSIVIWVFAFFEAVTSPAEQVRNLSKPLWLVVILVLFLIGALFWLFLGRPRPPDTAGSPARTRTTSAEQPDPSATHGPSGGAQPRGPDDDPEFLRRLNKRINPED